MESQIHYSHHRRILLMIAFILSCYKISAIDSFLVDGLYYNIISGTNEVYVKPPFGIAKRYTGEITIPETVKDYDGTVYTVVGIGESAFALSSITSISLPNTLRFIEQYAFTHCSQLKTLQLPNRLESIGRCFISKSGITHIKIPNSVTNIAKYAFGPDVNSERCQLESIDLTELSSSVTELPEGMFSTCCLRTITIPNTIRIIGKEAFMSCDKLELVISKRATPPVLDTRSFHGISSNAKLVVPNGSLDAYKNSTSWSIYFTEIVEESATHNLTIISIGSGYTKYNGTIVRGETTSFTVNEGASATLTINPDDGYRIKSVKLNSTDVTSSVTNNQYTISNITANTTLEVEFEAIPITTYTLSIKANGNGSASYDGNTICSKTSTFTVNEGTKVAISLTPDNGYRIKSVKENGTNLTSYLSNGTYTINSISRDMNIEVEFEAIPPTTYTLSIKASGNGSASYDGNTIRSKTGTFTVNEGVSATITFSPDNGYRVKNVKMNNNDVTSSVTNNQYTISNIKANTTLEVEFEAIPISTYTLSIKATGNGSASYDGNTIRSKTSTFTVNEGTKVAISLTPDNGYRIKSIKENNTIVTSYISNGTYTINSISRDTNVEVEFEAIPPTTYTLSIKATGNGSASYDGTAIRGKTSSYTVNEGTSATIKFTPDNGYRIKSVKLNSTNVTSSVYDNQYTISNINANTTLEVEFEVIPITTYTLTIKATGNGSASYNGTAIRGKNSSFTVNEGTKVSISLTPDNGYRIKSVKENNTNLTSYVSNGTYTINSISRNTNVEVEFEAIPPTTYTLSIKTTGNGSASYDGTAIRGKTSSFTVNEGTSATIKFTLDNGYRLKSVKLNSTNVTSGVSDNQYTISNITANATLEVEFEAIPVPTYTLSITTTGNGSSTYDGIEVKNRMTSFTVNKGTNATITFSPDNGNSIASVKLNNSEVTSQVSGNRYTINNITDNTTLIVTFQEDVKALTVDGVNYTVVSQADRTVKVTGGDFGQVLTVPATVTQNGKTWTVTGIEGNALNGNTQLAAVIWNPEVAFTATVSNPNMLLYVKAEQYAPSAIQNVVVNGIASNIILTEAQSGNNFYCPQTFVAQKISYTHNYQMQTGLGESKGWETIALPFDVQTITHETKGTIVPFAQWNNESYNKPFWLMELTGNGFVEAGSIKAYTPYIISMPNHPQYESQWLLNGKVTFAASSVTVGKTENLNQSVNNGRTFVPCFAGEKADEGFYALNVSNDWETNKSGMTEGSKFVLNMRQVHPFEAYMTSSSNAAQYFDVFDDMTTGIHQMVDGKWMMEKAVYDLQGRKVENPSKKGVYIVNGKKKIIK